MPSSMSLSCPSCGASHTVTVYDSINVSENPSLKAAVLDGSLFTWKCPACGKTGLIGSRVLYHDPASSLMVWMTGEDRVLEATVKDRYDNIEELKDYTLRFTSSVGDLIEKVKIHEAALDDIAMEMCKWVTCNEMEAGQDLRLKFLKLEGADSEIIFTYPKDGQMEMVSVGFNVYEDSVGIIQRNPVIRERATGFIRLDSGWLSQFFR